MNTFAIRVSELRDLNPSFISSQQAEPVRFSLDRDAGTFTFNGQFGGGTGQGTYAFKPNSVFVEKLQKRSIDAPTQSEQLEMARQNVSIDFIDELIRSGITHLTAADLAAVAISGLSLPELHAMMESGARFRSATSLISTFNARPVRAQPSPVRSTFPTGSQPTPSSTSVRAPDTASDHEALNGTWLVKTSRSGQRVLQLNWSDGTDWSRPLTGSEISSVNDTGFEIAQSAGKFTFNGNLNSPSSTQSFHFVPDHTFERTLQSLGIQNVHALSAHDLKNLAFGYISTDAIKEFQAAGLRQMSLDDLITLGIRQVSPGFVRAAERNGLASPSVQDILNFKFGGGKLQRR